MTAPKQERHRHIAVSICRHDHTHRITLACQCLRSIKTLTTIFRAYLLCPIVVCLHNTNKLTGIQSRINACVVLAEIPRPDDTTANVHIFRHSASKALLRMADKEGIATNLNPRARAFDTAYFLRLDLVDAAPGPMQPT